MIVGNDEKQSAGTMPAPASCRRMAATPSRSSTSAPIRSRRDPRQPAADQHHLRPADQPRDHARRRPRAGRQLGQRRRRSRRAQVGARQPALGHRPDANPPTLIDTVTVGKQPSGMSINRAGTLALIANRADNSISVLRIAGKKVELIDTVAIGEQVAHVASRRTASARWRPSSRATRSRCSTSTARRSATTSTT